MAIRTFSPTFFNGVAIDASPYASKFLRAHDPFLLEDKQPVEVAIPGEWSHPTAPRSQGGSIVLPLFVKLVDNEQTTLDAFKLLFDRDAGDVLLLATDGLGSPTTWRLTVRVMNTPTFSQSELAYVVRLYVATPIWQNDSLTAPAAESASATPTTFTRTVTGVRRTLPILQFKPTVNKSQDDDLINRIRVTMINRSENPLHSTTPPGIGLPIDLTNAGFDTTTEQGAGRILASLNDLIVLQNGRQVRRDNSPAMDDANTKVWISPVMKGALHATVKTAITIGPNDPADGGEIEVAETAGIPIDFDEKGWLRFTGATDETIYYGSRDKTKFKDILRASRGTTAGAHAADTDIWFVEHDFQLLTNYTAATDPNTDTDRKPVIDLANSTNLVHKYPGPLWTPGTLRSGQLLPRFFNDNLLSPAVSFLDDGTDGRFRDTAPSASAPKFNALELYVPCGIKAAASAIVHDVTVQDAMTLAVVGIDLEGLETLLQRYNSANDGAAVTLQPSAVLSRLRYVANLLVVTGGKLTDDADEALGLSAASVFQTFTLDSDTLLEGVAVRIKKTGTPANNARVEVMKEITDGDTVDPDGLSNSFDITPAEVSTSYTDVPVLFDDSSSKPKMFLAAGIYTIRMFKLDAGDTYEWSRSGTGTPTSGALVYPSGKFFDWSGGSIRERQQTARFLVLGVDKAQADAPSGDAAEVVLDDLAYTFDDTNKRTPLTLLGSQETIYMARWVFKNDDTGQTITIDGLPMELNDVLEIDCALKTVKLIPTNSADPTIDVPWAVIFSDEDEWMRFDPGTVNLRFTETAIGTVEITTKHRDRWG